MRAVGRRIARIPQLLTGSWSRTADAPTVQAALEDLREAYKPKRFDFPSIVILSDEFQREMLPPWHLRRLVQQPRRWFEFPGSHSGIALPPTVDTVAKEIREAIDATVASA